MERWWREHRAFVIETFLKNNDSATLTQRVFRRHFIIGRNRRVPTQQTILNWVKEFRTTASAVDRKPQGRPRTIRTPENVERVRVALQRSLRRSARQHSVVLDMSDRSVRRMLHEDLHFHPFKIQMVQELIPRDLKQRVQFFRNLLQMIDVNPQFLNHLIVTDEAHFHLNEYVNKQNFRYWAPENPRLLHQAPLLSKKATVSCGVSALGILGPYFF
jgi:transposase